jgi:hypothetical protein
VSARLGAWVATAALLAATGCAATVSRRETQDAAARGAAYFHDRDFGSPHQTGVPYALAMATIERYPDALGGDRDRFCETFGLLSRPDRPHGLPNGFALRRDGLTGLDFAMTNCSLCHDGAIDGRIVSGLGNRELRINALARAVIDVVSRDDWNVTTMLPLARDAARRHHTPWGWRQAWGTRVAIRRIKQLAGGGSGGAFAGLANVDAGPGRNSAIEFAKAASNVPIAPPYSSAKFPAVWVYRKRSTFGYDGSIVGDHAMALSAVEFNKRMPPKDIVRRGAIWRSVEAYLAALEPPRYPGTIDPALADSGHAVFRARCSGCHGTYAQGGDPEHYRERVVPLSIVGTDGDRLHSVTADLIAARRRGPLARYVHIEGQDGYVPPPLDGIWCRGPYLHNGSVPTLADLLLPPRERPIAFYVGSGTAYDLERVGLAYAEQPAAGGRRAGGRASPPQARFDTALPGNGNGGHDFSAALSNAERRALLEYLKRL